jgi:enoyl-CoA hydratase/carnithine racemase
MAETRGPIRILRLNRPDARNALSPELSAALGRALQEAGEDPGVRCLILTGTGDRAFCAGMDLRAFSEGRPTSPGDEAGMSLFRDFLRGSGPAKPVIGAAQATAVAGGLEVLLACDLVVASEAAQFGLPEVKRGLIAAGEGVLLAYRLSRPLALELTLTGEPISARRAYEMGLVNRVVPPYEVLDAALALAESIVGNGPLAVAASKRITRASAEDTTAARRMLDEAIPQVFGSADAKEGAAAFLERRDPVWTGR